jgi:lipopolysaccharide transport system ATP-binding protein
LEPDVLFVDEILAVGDSAFRIKCYNKIMGLRERMATIFVSHSMPQVARLSTCGLVLGSHQSPPAVRSVSDTILAYFETISSASSFLEGCHSVSLEEIRIEQDGLAASVATPWPSQPRHVGELKGEAPLSLIVAITPFPVVTPVMALWSITDIDQRLVAQTASNSVTLPSGGECFDLVTQIEALNLNNGRFTLSVHLLASANGERGAIVAGLRDILSFSIVRGRFAGPANILYPASSYVDASRRSAVCCGPPPAPNSASTRRRTAIAPSAPNITSG